MKYKIILTLISFLISSALFGEEKKDNFVLCTEPDSFSPSNTALFIKVIKISKAIDFLNSKNDSYKINNLILKNIKWIQILKDKTNIDILNTKSLKDIGIDVNKALYLTSFGYEKDEHNSVLFIPITDKKNFPFYFIKFLKLINKDKTNPDLNPAISMYKDIRVFQIPNKIFFAIIDDYFVLTSSGNSLSNIIDIKTSGCTSSLSMNPIYRDYKAKSEIDNESNIVNVYLQKKFFENTYKAAREKKDKDTKIDIPAQKPNLNFINYISLSLASETEDLSFRGILSVNKEDPYGDLLLNVVTTGLFDNALFADNPTGYHFISIDMDKINEHFKAIADKNDSAYRAYAKIIKPDKNTNFLKDTILPCSKSFINIIFKKAEFSGEMDNFLIFIPMKECGDIKKSLKNLKNELEKNHTEEGTFGEEKIDEHNSFWFKNDSNNKINILEYNGNLYAGNNVEFIKTILDSSDKKSSDIKNDFIKRIDKNTFLLSYTQFDDESFLKAILMMLAYNNNPELYGLISKIESIYFTGKKIDNDLILNLRLKMLRSSK